MDTKLPPYRILFQREVNTMCLQIAVGETKAAIDAAWNWIEKNMIPELETIDHPYEKERWVSEKINMIVTAIGKQFKQNDMILFLNLGVSIEYGTDELSSDEKVRNASRTFRQVFDIPHSERFVNC